MNKTELIHKLRSHLTVLKFSQSEKEQEEALKAIEELLEYADDSETTVRLED